MNLNSSLMNLTSKKPGVQYHHRRQGCDDGDGRAPDEPDADRQPGL
ncbi:Uncharacterised protein [Lelliottia amnigena]|nr:Uncharacterised protein [Lelliottia amnigena]